MKENLNPLRRLARPSLPLDSMLPSSIDVLEIFEHIRHIRDPQYPNSLQQLSIVQPQLIQLTSNKHVHVKFVPTIPHCSMAQMIGLMIKVKLMRSLPKNYKITVTVQKDSHISQQQINKQLQDKQRVLAATQNNGILRVIHRGIRDT